MNSFAFSTFLATSLLTGAATIEVAPHTYLETNKKQITLGDVAKFEDFSADELKYLKDIPLGNSPDIGETRHFTNSSIAEIFRFYLNKVKKTQPTVQLKIPEKIQIEKKDFALKSEEVLTELVSQLKEKCADCTFKILDLSLPIITNVSGSSTWKLDIRGEIPRGHFSLPVVVQPPNNDRRIYWIKGTLIVYQLVPVVRRAVSIGEKVVEQDIEFQKRDVTHSRDGSPTTEEMYSSYFARGLNANQIVGRNDLRREHALKIGQIVEIVTGKKTWEITVKGIAQQNAYVGDTIKVLNPSTKKIIYGTVVSKGQVRVDLE